MALLDEGDTTCCYARSEKHWVTDPQGIAWEHFHTLGNIPVFSEGVKKEALSACCAPSEAKEPQVTESASCCPPSSRGKPVGVPVKASGSCC